MEAFWSKMCCFVSVTGHGSSHRPMTQNTAKTCRNVSDQNTGPLKSKASVSPDLNPIEQLWKELKHGESGWVNIPVVRC